MKTKVSGYVMKRALMILAVLCIGSLSGCGSENSAEEKQPVGDTGQEYQPLETEEAVMKNADYSAEFDGVSGCAVIYHPQDHLFKVYNREMSEKQASPCSTFKIISALMGLKNHVIEDENSTMNYDGTQYPSADWNGHLSLQQAFGTSCIWYFRQVIDAVGQDEVKRELEQLKYGNCDIDQWEGSDVNPLPDLNGFWLESSLEISPMEQVRVIADIFEGNSIYDRKDINVLKKIMQMEDGGSIYGKTGTGADGESWFVGFEERGDRNVYFAVYLNDAQNRERVSGVRAKEIAQSIVSQAG